jgi:hypothetical protein
MKISESEQNKKKTIYIVMCMRDYRRGFWLVSGFIGHLQIVTTSNYNVIISSHTLQFTTARIKSSQSAVSSSVVAW